MKKLNLELEKLIEKVTKNHSYFEMGEMALGWYARVGKRYTEEFVISEFGKTPKEAVSKLIEIIEEENKSKSEE